MMKNRNLIVLTGSTSGIGKFTSNNLKKEFDLLHIVRPEKYSVIKKNLASQNNKNSFILSYNLKKKLNTNNLRKLIKFKNYKNIHLIFFAGKLDVNPNKFDFNDWQETFNVNLFSHLSILNFFLPYILSTRVISKVIFFSGGGAANSFPAFPAYSASKTALVRTVENLGEIYSKSKVNIFAVAPGAVKTKMLKKVLKQTRVGTKSKIEDVSNFIINSINSNTKSFHGRLINIKDSKKKIYKNTFNNYLKLRRVDEYIFNRDG